MFKLVTSLIAVALFALAGAHAAHAAKRVALVIGNSDYKNVAQLPNPENDATDMQAALAQIGFEVHRIDNVGKAELEAALADFSDAAVGADIALVFYAGHGLEVDRQNYLIPVDARLETDRRLPFEAVSLDHVMVALEAVKGTRIVLLDACRDNPFARSMRSNGATRSIGRGLARIEASSGTVIGFAAKEGTVARDGEGRNSPFTAALLGNLARPGVELSYLFRLVRDEVIEATGGEQEPYVSASLSSRQVYLVPPDAAAPSSASAPTAPAPSAPASDGLHEQAARAWDVTKDTTSPAILRAYVERFDGTIYADFARARLEELASLAPPTVETENPQTELPPAPQARDFVDLVRAVQSELDRLGCDPGTIDGVWGPQTQASLARFNQHSQTRVASSVPSEAMLSTLEGAQGRVCPLTCGPQFDLVGDQCVRKTCPPGTSLSSDGACQPAGAISPSRPGTNPQAAGEIAAAVRAHARCLNSCRADRSDQRKCLAECNRRKAAAQCTILRKYGLAAGGDLRC